MSRLLLNKRFALSGLLLLVLVLPLITSNAYMIRILILTFIWTIAVYGLNLLAGYTGYLSLAHAGFFALGAYTLAILTVTVGLSYWLAFILTLVFTSIVGALIGMIALRTREHFFAIYTLCVGYIIYLIIYNWEGMTGGVRGFIGIPSPGSIGPLEFNSQISNYYLVLFFLVLTIVVIYRIVHSLQGRTFMAIRNSEDLAKTIGISTTKNKLIAFILSTFFAGLAGALFASFTRFIGPEISNITMTFDFLVYLLIGGIGTLSGPVIGTFIIVWISQELQFLQDYRMLVFGPILVILIIFAPRGISGFIIDWNLKRKAKKQQIESMKDMENNQEVKEG
ncbi:branched-chain amino acid ABC transporter permease [Piscibacillus halophilus]|uniref:Amino acid/amide ABC transporter membrane protein 2, HAAT family n=1 Tax=Piscibacillus halophilus TaxID=571933 RepID=A0A1H9HIK0_9BACI|nr:branched-chain amino acid ABC transporter permease [Piscibacillus halophilus]SEQ62108.1 amino acid/amide ABC transporter membrane protein 2, HAAT family [Piscibacillus halophilus]